MTFVDVGANWGYFTLLAAAQIGPTGRVMSVEPDPRLFTLLNENVAANAFENVSLIQAAAMAEPGVVRLTGFDADGGNWGLTGIETGTDKRAFAARATTIDAELNALGIDQVDLVKMDIEGAEDAALAGMAGGLRAGRYARLLVELHPDYLASRGSSAIAIIDGMLAAGYRAWQVRHDRATTRRAAYARKPDPESLVVPWESGQNLGPWPHVLFAKDTPFPIAACLSDTHDE